MATGFLKKNIEREQRNGKSPESQYVVKYITQIDRGNDGQDAYQVILSPNNHQFIGGAEHAAGAQSTTSNIFVFRGTNLIDAYVDDSNIEIKDSSDNTVSDISVSIAAGTNGTNAVSLQISCTENLNKESGTIKIPVKYNVDTIDGSTAYDPTIWDASQGWTYATFDVIYSWTLIKSGESLFLLDLTNENASINCDSSGNILRGARRPKCTAKLFFGMEPYPNAYYEIVEDDADYVAAQVQGLSINNSTGVLTFNDGSANTPFSFYPDSSVMGTLAIPIRARIGGMAGAIKGNKTMNVTKSIPGVNGTNGTNGTQGPMGPQGYNGSDGAQGPQGAMGPQGYNGSDGAQGATGPQGPQGYNGTDGKDAVSYWLDFSADEVRVDVNNGYICYPSTIEAYPWKQVGENEPEIATDAFVYYDYDSSIAGTLYENPITVDASKDYLTFQMWMDGLAIETETIPILRDGKNGTNGTDGRNGAAIRGPIRWNSSLTRWFFSGKPDVTGHAESSEFIDIVYVYDASLNEGHYYKCKASYYQENNPTWNSVAPDHWEQADAEYAFIATQLLLAANAKINFLSGNEIYLTNTNDVITGGARAADSSSDVVFWAGSQDPSTGNFRVDASGNIFASSGIFSGFVRIPYISLGSLSTRVEYDGIGYEGDNNTNLRLYDTDYDSSLNTSYITVHIDDSSTKRIGPVIYLPEPTYDRNGMTYKIILPDKDRIRGVSEVIPWLAIAVKGMNINTNMGKMYDLYHVVDKIGIERGISVVALYKGYIEITCMSNTHNIQQGGSFGWYITNCTGPVDLYGPYVANLGLITNNKYALSCGNVITYSKNSYSNMINKVVADASLQGADDTLYVER